MKATPLTVRTEVDHIQPYPGPATDLEIWTSLCNHLSYLAVTVKAVNS